MSAHNIMIYEVFGRSHLTLITQPQTTSHHDSDRIYSLTIRQTIVELIDVRAYMRITRIPSCHDRLLLRFLSNALQSNRRAFARCHLILDDLPDAFDHGPLFLEDINRLLHFSSEFFFFTLAR